MADLFGNRGFWQDSGCLSTEKKEGKTEDSDLVELRTEKNQLRFSG